MAFFGFYSSVRLDLPLGPTDVALGCCLIFLAYGLSRVIAKHAPRCWRWLCAALIAKRLQRQNRRRRLFPRPKRFTPNSFGWLK